MTRSYSDGNSRRSSSSRQEGAGRLTRRRWKRGKGEDVYLQEIQSPEFGVRGGQGKGGGGGGKDGRRARFLVYRGINPYPQLPFVLGAAWSTCKGAPGAVAEVCRLFRSLLYIRP
ncbi:hypothetical protein PUN28_011676 [Cardiocondyla obscurior]|uniref:Uncharacterized protein n=1 Tax=Cardiocondyla obscurior TaxID=286306 RepID=A0AAW2FIR0_9HYME